MDKHAAIIDPLFALGPGIVEIGGCTPQRQDGNEKPRIFRLPSQKALVNRCGLNSHGIDHISMRLRQRVREFSYSIGFGIDDEAEQRVLDGEAGVPGGSLMRGKLMAVQVAKNKSTPDDDIEAVKADYVYCVDTVARYADVIVLNVSSPNTPGLRDLQRVEPLTNILKGVVEAATRTKKKIKPAVMVKVSPDEDSEEQVQGICDAVWESGADGVIVGNTTKRRGPDLLPAGTTLPSREAALLLEDGGYSGPQLFERTVALTRRYRTLLDEALEEKSQNVPSSQPQNSSENDLPSRLEETTARDAANLKPNTPEANASSKSQPLIRLPSRNSPFSTDDSSSTAETPALSASHHLDQIPPKTPPSPGKDAPRRKVIFATGGITTGQEAQAVLAAGADVAQVSPLLPPVYNSLSDISEKKLTVVQVYTAMVYGGVGTISRIKSSLRDEREKATQ